MRLDESHPANRLVLRHMKRGGARGPAIAAPDSHPDPYWQLGSHPDAVQRVWDGLGSGLPTDGRAIVFGTPALVHPDRGVVLALAYGTAYVIRIIPNECVDLAIRAGCTLERTWTGGGQTNIQEELGDGWVFGGWLAQEAEWLVRTYNELSVSNREHR